MNHIIKNLKEWTIRFLKNKDLIFRRIVEISEKEDSFIVKYKDKEQEFFVSPSLEDFDNVLSKINEGQKALVIINNKSNLDIVVKNWSKLTTNPSLAIYFINPFSHTGKSWIIFPHTHNKIAEGENIKEGLTTLYSNVEPIKMEEYQKIVNS